MGLTEIANHAADRSDGKQLGQRLLEQIKGCFDEPGFKEIEDHLRRSGFKVTHERYSDGCGDFAYAFSSVAFAKNGLECSIEARLHEGRATVFHFERSDKPERIHGRELEARTIISAPKDAYLLIQDFVMENLPQLSKPPGLVGYVKKRAFG